MSDSSYNQFCPVAMAAEILGARWTLVLLRELVVGSTRFGHPVLERTRLANDWRARNDSSRLQVL